MYYFYYFPLGTEGRLQRVPLVTIGLTIALGLVHYLLHHFEPTVHLYYAWILSVESPTLLQAFTACFIHGNWFHLIGNLLYLATFGPALEDRIGRGAFLAFYLVAGLVSMLVQVEISQMLPPAAQPQYVLGASGAIAGVLGIFLTRAWFLRVRVAHATFAFLQAQARGGVIALPAWIALLAWSGLQGIYTLVSMETSASSVAYWSHISGLLVGVGVGIGFGMIGKGKKESRLIRARRYMEEGSWFAALGEFQTFQEHSEPHSEAKLGEARCFRLLGRSADSVAAYIDAFNLLVRDGEWETAAVAVKELRRMSGHAGLDPVKLARVAENLFEGDDILRAAGLLEQAGRWDPNPARGAGFLEQAADIARIYVGDLGRAAEGYRFAAARLTTEGRGANRLERVKKLEKQSAQCRRVLAQRLHFASRGA